MKRFIESYHGEIFDVIVIGGGITGASVAYEAASRGLTVALVEKKDFSWATSAVTSKLIHGGFRYLVNGEIGLVRESLRERRVMGNIAPNFIYPVPIMMTHDTGSLKNSKEIVKMGMIFYDLLSYDKKRTWDKSKAIPNHYCVGRDDALRLEPYVKAKGLTGASIFYDCASIFPERLTLAFIKSAVQCGAQVSNYAQVNTFLYNANRHIDGVKVIDLIRHNEHDLKGKIVINCSGPWVDLVLGLAQKKACGDQIRRSEGIHIITKKKLVSGSRVVCCMTPKGRHFFLIPWRNHTLIGTTDKPYLGNPDAYLVTKNNILELIDEVNASFGEGSLCYEDVRHTYGGLRPLVEDQTKETYSSSRRYEICDNGNDGLEGLVTVEGGKYTTSRNLAETCINLVEKKGGKALRHSISNKRHLCGCEINSMEDFRSELHANFDKSFPRQTVEYLCRNYGTEAKNVLKMACGEMSLAETVNDDGELLAQVLYAIREEMARSLSDIVLRRTGIGTLGNPGKDVLEKVAAVAAREFNWDDVRISREIEEVERLLQLPGV